MMSASQRVLVVDDVPDLAELTRAWLTAVGHECQVATSGMEGIRIASWFAPEVALVDIGLPDISGYDVARTLRALFANAIYLAAITGGGEPQQLRQARCAGFDMHVLKPANPATIESVMAAARRGRVLVHRSPTSMY